MAQGGTRAGVRARGACCDALSLVETVDVKGEAGCYLSAARSLFPIPSMNRRIASLPTGLLLLTSLATAQVTPVCTETFEYPIGATFHGLPGGTGWSNNWYVDGAGNAAYLVQDNTMTPNFALTDGVGGHAVQQFTWNSAYRQIDLAAHPDLLDTATNMWGRDGAVLWLSLIHI